VLSRFFEQQDVNDDTKYLLDDQAMQRFIVEGYLTLHSELPRDYHARIYDELEPLDETGPMGHNNLLPCVPDLRAMIEEPVVVGALTSLLGPDYYLHFHRHDHVNYPDGAQPLHKDGDNHSHQAVDGWRRYHPTRYAMLFYYPQDTPVEAGPTGIVPRSQYVLRRDVENVRREADAKRGEIMRQMREDMDAEAFRGTNRFKRYAELERELSARYPDLVAAVQEISTPWEDAKIPLSGDAGTISIVHFDLVHGRFAANVTGRQRHMVKFLFSRKEEPTRPSWNHVSPAWQGPADDSQKPIWQHIWSWHLGTNDTTMSSRTIDDLTIGLADTDDAKAIGAAYELGSTQPGLSVLFERFFSDDAGLRSIASYGIARAGQAGLPTLLARLDEPDVAQQVRIIDVIGDIGPAAVAAVEAITRFANSPEVTVRRAAIEALGMLTQLQSTLDLEVVGTLSGALNDEDAIVVRNATFAISRLGAKACNDEIVDRLNANLAHWHHHVRGWSIEALQRIDDPRALQLALRYLMSARWDPLAKSGDRPVTSKAMSNLLE
jgi:hypothetical protein